jgi:hypothetical protein
MICCHYRDFAFQATGRTAAESCLYSAPKRAEGESRAQESRAARWAARLAGSG